MALNLSSKSWVRCFNFLYNRGYLDQLALISNGLKIKSIGSETDIKNRFDLKEKKIVLFKPVAN